MLRLILTSYSKDLSINRMDMDVATLNFRPETKNMCSVKIFRSKIGKYKTYLGTYL